MARVKICGIQNTDDLIASHQAGADWVGLVFFPKSPRHLTLDQAANIRASADKLSGIKTPLLVALVVDASDDQLDGITSAMRPDLIQCHGNESPERIAEIKTRYGAAVMKAIRVKSKESLVDATAYDGIADMLLFDSAPIDATLPGGTGHAFDWGMMDAYIGTSPWMLAGGLTPANVGDAIKISGTMAVDVSSGVEKTPGKKDHAAIQHFVSAAL